ncbi:MAG: hypothetical protein LBD58_01810 [Treponema sp.]|jgi:hypothetical protein|nr:hypothetical protein [Treponema sp.]
MKNRSKLRRFPAGIIAALAALAALASGCGAEDPPPPPMTTESGRNWATALVRLPQRGQSGASRSAAPEAAAFFANFYEVVFKRMDMLDAAAKEAANVEWVAMQGQLPYLTKTPFEYLTDAQAEALDPLLQAAIEADTVETLSQCLAFVRMALATVVVMDPVWKETIEYLFGVMYKAFFFYRGEGSADQGYISVAVPAGGRYEVLLLAGYDRNLVGAGYRGSHNASPDVVEIKAGRVNEVAIAVEAFPPQWNTKAENEIKTYPVVNDFEFEADVIFGAGNDASIRDRYIQLGPATGLKDAYSPKDLVIKARFNLAKFTPLILADVTNTGSSDTLSIAKCNAQLIPRYIDDYFAPVPLSPVANDPDEEGKIDTKSPFSVTEPLSFKGEAEFLKKRDVDGLLAFELTYYAFGVPESGGIPWSIRNGLNGRAEDDIPERDGDGKPTGRGVGAGSRFLLKFGAGSAGSAGSVIVNVE